MKMTTTTTDTTTMTTTTRRLRPAFASLACLALLLAACGDDPPAPGTTPTDGGGGADLTAGDGGGDAGHSDPGQPLEDTAADPGPPPADVAADPGADPGAADTAADDTGDDAGAGDVGGDTQPPPKWTTCSVDADCDDGLACTTDACVTGEPGQICHWAVVSGQCLINNVCRASGAAKAGNPCIVCDPAADPLAWTQFAAGAACDDGDACTSSDVCDAAATCAGATTDCDDGDACTVDACDPTLGCTHEAPAELACDDGDPCTGDDACVDGACAGAPLSCDDGDQCTTDVCDAALGACVNTAGDGPCEDGDPCTVDEACDLATGACGGGVPNTCDDGNQCTLDVCDPDVGCYSLASQSPCCIGATSICDDNDVCTTDVCDPDTTGCSYEFNTAPCDDGTICTQADACDAGTCAGAAIDCDDGNPCTDDSCSPSVGCLHPPTADGTTCDDGLDCSVNDACAAGQCGGDMTGCVCTPVFQDGVKLNSVLIGEDGTPGEGLDLDNNPATCAPSTTGCSDGIDNNLGILAGFANDALAGAVADGSFMLILDLRDRLTGPFTLGLFTGGLDPANAGCDHMTATCDYQVSPSLVNADTCEPTISLPATLTGDHLSAGGVGSTFPFSIPFGAGATLEITLYDARFEATVTLSGDNVVTLNGILGGAVPKQQLLDAVDLLPADALPAGISKDLIVTFLGLVDNDYDTDGNGSLDAATIGIKVQGIDGVVTGVTP